MMSPTRVLAVDDHPIVLEGLVRFAAVEPALEIVGTRTSLEGLEESLAELKPDVLSLDVQVPGMTGAGTVGALCPLGHPILLFTLMATEELLASLVRAGAKGYLHKSSSMATYLEAVQALRAGERWLPPSLASLAESDASAGPRALLTARELEIFEHLRRGTTIKEVAFELRLSTSTVYNHFDRIRKKLGVDSAAELVRYAAKWRFDPP